MHELLYEAISMIGFYSRAAHFDENEDAKQQAEGLDESGREEIVFRALDTPCDKVNLAVITSLKSVTIDQIDLSEGARVCES